MLDLQKIGNSRILFRKMHRKSRLWLLQESLLANAKAKFKKQPPVRVNSFGRQEEVELASLSFLAWTKPVRQLL